MKYAILILISVFLFGCVSTPYGSFDFDSVQEYLHSKVDNGAEYYSTSDMENIRDITSVSIWEMVSMEIDTSQLSNGMRHSQSNIFSVDYTLKDRSNNTLTHREDYMYFGDLHEPRLISAGFNDLYFPVQQTKIESTVYHVWNMQTRTEELYAQCDVQDSFDQYVIACTIAADSDLPRERSGFALQVEIDESIYHFFPSHQNHPVYFSNDYTDHSRVYFTLPDDLAFQFAFGVSVISSFMSVQDIDSKDYEEARAESASLIAGTLFIRDEEHRLNSEFERRSELNIVRLTHSD